MSENLSLPNENRSGGKRKVLWVLLFLCLFVLSITVARPFLTNPSTYHSAMVYLDEKLENAKMISLGTTSASFVVSLIPDDSGTPIANELAKLSGYLLIVISAIFLERYLLTSIGLISTLIILPLACLFSIAAVCARSGSKMKLKEYAFRLFIFSICVVLIIPVGCQLGREIEKTNAQSIEMALEDARNANEIVQSIPDEGKSKNVFERIGDFFAGLWNSAAEAYEWAKTVLSNFMSSIAIMLITTIAIPILIFFAFLWLIKFLTKRDFVIAVVNMADSIADKTRRKLVGNRHSN